MNNKIKISIVTVVYNNCSMLENTILSIAGQVCSDFEYIIIDGNSTDGTIDLIKKYDKYISSWISEEDSGIYDAMNKGIIKSSGDFVFFLNAGDIFYDDNVLLKVTTQIMTSDNISNVVFLGNICCCYNSLNLGVVHASNKLNSWYSPPHQGMFIPLKLLKNNFFDLRFKLLADRELLLRIIKNDKCSVHLLNIIISKYDLGGVSSNMSNSFKLFNEGLLLDKIYPSGKILIIKAWIKSILKKTLSILITDNTFYKILYKINQL